MNQPRRMLLTSAVLILTGAVLLILVIGFYFYSRFTTWIVAQPRALAASQMIWLDVPPLTPLPSPTSLPTPAPTPTPLPTPVPTPTSVSHPPVWIEIPKLGIERTIVPLEAVYREEKLVWDVESLFATSNRRDLVGHMAGTASPGERGNIVLAGHNYNWGLYNWTGVFYALGRIQEGDLIHLTDESNARFTYQVEQIEQIPWRASSNDNILDHIAHLSPTPDETVTLITCVGANVPFAARLYVTAKRIDVVR